MIDQDSVLPLHLWRRLDWRFLLPAVEPGPIVCAGRPDDELRSALPLLGPDIRLVTSARDWDGLAGTASVVVLVDPGPDDLRRAATACRPGGWVYAELRRSLVRSRGPRTILGWRRAFQHAGLGSVAAHWHARTIARSAKILPVEAAGAVHRAFGQRGGMWSRYVLAVVARAAVSARLLPILIPEGSVIGRRPPLDSVGGDELR